MMQETDTVFAKLERMAAKRVALEARHDELLELCKDVLHGLQNWTTKEFSRGFDANMRQRLADTIAKTEGVES